MGQSMIEQAPGAPPRLRIARPALASRAARLLTKATLARRWQIVSGKTIANVEELAPGRRVTLRGAMARFRSGADGRTSPRTHPSVLVQSGASSLLWRVGLTPPLDCSAGRALWLPPPADFRFVCSMGCSMWPASRARRSASSSGLSTLDNFIVGAGKLSTALSARCRTECNLARAGALCEPVASVACVFACSECL